MKAFLYSILFLFSFSCGLLETANYRSISSTSVKNCFDSLEELLFSARSMENKLKNMKIKGDIRRFVAGDNPVYLITLEDGTQGIFKPLRAGFFTDYRSEVAAYRISETLNFGLVPPTVERDFFGETGSFQLYIQRAKDGEFIDSDIKDSEAYKTIIFNYLIADYDRHPGNYLIDQEENIFLIDHGYSFSSKMGREDNSSLTESVIESLEIPEISGIAKRFLEMSEEEVIEMVSILPLDKAEIFFKRFNLISEFLRGHPVTEIN